jgi:hypothetical protein
MRFSSADPVIREFRILVSFGESPVTQPVTLTEPLRYGLHRQILRGTQAKIWIKIFSLPDSEGRDLFSGIADLIRREYGGKC